MGALTARQLAAIQASERTMSILSIVGSLFIITTFSRWHYFRKPINRLVFYASFGNLMCNVATLISLSALPRPPNHFSSLCEFQGILIQWFMMADSLWVFCMALNVMLVFFYNYDSRQLRHLEKWYLLFSYGLPGIPAIVYIILDHVGPQRIIGPATIWCWVSAEVEWMRLAFFYGPVWVVVCATLSIYIVTGRKIFKKRAELRSFSKRASDPEAKATTLSNPFTAGDLRNIKVETELKVETHTTLEQDSAPTTLICGNESRSSFASTRHLSNSMEASGSAEPRFSRVKCGASSPLGAEVTVPKSVNEPDTGYRATAFSTNQVSGAEIKAPRLLSIGTGNPNRRRNAAMEGNAAAWGYFKVAFLMFTALFIVWVPSTVNRLQQFIHRDNAVYGLNLASAMVLPLQGFWNSMVYISTTWPECKRAFAETMDFLSRDRRARRPVSYENDVDYKCNANETREFGPAISLHRMTSISDSESSHLPRVSSTEMMKSPVSHHER